MRDIKFRGKRLDNGEWVYGCLCCIDNEPVIVEGSMKWVDGSELYCNTFHFVIPESVGQYTGLKDKNGKEIYEGDAVIANLHYFNIKNEICKVIFKNGSFGIQYGYCDDYFKSFAAWDNFEVIGNIHDNPELMQS